MPRFIAVHTMPGVSEEQVIALAKGPTPKGLTWKLSYCDLKSGKFFNEWEAGSKEALEEFFKAGNAPFDGVYPVRLFNPAKKKFEDK